MIKFYHMKKLSAIVLLSLLFTSSIFAKQISCEGVNSPNVRFIISDDSIILSDSGGSVTFDKKWNWFKDIYKGKIKTKWDGDKRVLTLQIDLKRGEAQLVTTTYSKIRNYFFRYKIKF